eukprot:8617801-Alexandrium_andersonii.AAC.1
MVLPTIGELTRVLQAARAGRAAGEDSLPPEAVKAAAASLARLLHPIAVQAAMWCEDPVQWRGGLLAFFPK